jgi:hypothetical protein
MEKRNLLLIAFLIISILSTTVSASNIKFIDAAYLGNGTLTITDPEGNLLTILMNSTQVFEVNNTSAYMMDYQAGGLYGLHQEVFFKWNDGNFTGPEFNGLHFYLSWFANPVNFLMFLWIILLILLVLIA